MSKIWLLIAVTLFILLMAGVAGGTVGFIYSTSIFLDEWTMDSISMVIASGVGMGLVFSTLVVGGLVIGFVYGSGLIRKSQNHGNNSD